MSYELSQSYRQELDISPDPEQLFALTAVAAQVARRQQHLRPGRRYRHARFLRIDPYETAIVADDTDQIIGLEHKLAAHIRRIAPTPEMPKYQWSLRLTMSTWSTYRESSVVQAVSTRYRFEWDREAVLRAYRHAHQLPTGDRKELEDYLDRAYFADDAADILSAELEMEQVSRADCGQLYADIAALCSMSGRTEVRAE